MGELSLCLVTGQLELIVLSSLVRLSPVLAVHYKPASGRPAPVYPVCEYEQHTDQPTDTFPQISAQPLAMNPLGSTIGSHPFPQSELTSSALGPPPPSHDPQHDLYNYSSASSSSSSSPFASTSAQFHPSVGPNPPSFRFDPLAGRPHPPPPNGNTHFPPTTFIPSPDSLSPPPLPSTARPNQYQTSQHPSPSDWVPSQQPSQPPPFPSETSTPHPPPPLGYPDSEQARMEALALNENVPVPELESFLVGQDELFGDPTLADLAGEVPSAAGSLGSDGKDNYLLQMLWPGSVSAHLNACSEASELMSVCCLPRQLAATSTATGATRASVSRSGLRLFRDRHRLNYSHSSAASVNSFFACNPFSHQLFNKPRFLTRLNLPPTNPDFPHPVSLNRSLISLISLSTSHI